MDFNEYGLRASSLAHTEIKGSLTYAALGLVGEAGEIADKVKKVLRDDGGVVTEERRQALLLELGDVCWYCNQLANLLDSTLSEVARMNIDKLYSRKARGTLQGSGDNR